MPCLFECWPRVDGGFEKILSGVILVVLPVCSASLTRLSDAEVAELADALASGASGSNPIGVQIPASAPAFALLSGEGCPP